MRVRMKVQPSGTRNGVDWPPRGSEIDLPEAEAMDYIAGDMAEPVTTFPEAVETAVSKVKVEKRVGQKPPAAPPPSSGLTKGSTGIVG